MSKYRNIESGVTLVELVIVLGIVAVIGAMALPAFNRFRKNSALDASGQEIITALSEARGLTLSAKNATTYGVHFQSDKVVRFTGSTYATSSSANVNYIFDKRVSITSITLSGGGSDVYFKRLTGEANKSGTVVVTVTGQTTLRATTTISTSGIIE